MARSSTASEDAALGGLHRQELYRLWIGDGAGSLVDFRGFQDVDWISSIEVIEDVNYGIARLVISLHREVVTASTHLAAATGAGSPNVDVDDATGFDAGETINVGDTAGLVVSSISPGGGAGGSDRIVCTTPVGAVEAVDSAVVEVVSLAPLMNSDPAPVAEGRTVIFEIAVIPQGAVVDDATTYFWRELFRGSVDSEGWGGDDSVMRVACRDQGGLFKDTLIEVKRQYGNAAGTTPIEDVAQALLDDNLTSAPTLLVPTTPDQGVRLYNQRRETLYDALQKLAEVQAADFRYRWDDGSGSWRPTYLVLDRDKTTPDFTFDAGEYFNIPEFSRDAIPVRNRVIGIYERDASGAENDVVGQDGASIGSIGRTKPMILDLVDDPQFTSYDEAKAFVDLVVRDTAQPVPAQQVRFPIDWRIQLQDLIRLTANDVLFNQDQDQSVRRIVHRVVPGGSWTTTADLRGQPSGSVTRWWKRERIRTVRDDIENVGISVPVGTVPSASVKVQGTRIGSNARVDFTLKDIDLQLTTLRFKRRRSTDQGVDLDWITTWDIQNGTIGADEDITRSVYLGSEYTALIFEAIDSLGRKKGDEIDLTTFQVISKAISFTGMDLKRINSSDSFARNPPTGSLNPNAFGGSSSRYTVGFPVPVGVTLTEFATKATRKNANSQADIRLYWDEPNFVTLVTLLAANVHAASSSETEKTATLNHIVAEDNRYYFEAELYSDTANADASVRSLKVTYNSPSYTRTY